jgi:hypothetical protein
VTCPTVTDPAAGLSFRCVTSGITRTIDVVWALNLTKQVEPGWELAEGAERIQRPTAESLRRVTEAVRNQMLQLDSWGPHPDVHTMASKARTVDGAHGWLLETTFTLAAAYRRSHHLTVHAERMWLVAIPAGHQQVALWYVTLPDDVKALWRTVPKLIDSIRLR